MKSKNNVFNTEKVDLNLHDETVSVKSFAESLNLEIAYEGRKEITLNSICVARPGLQLTGYFTHFSHNRVQVIGRAEHEYLKAMKEEERDKNLDELFKRNIPCIIIANDLSVPKSLLQYAQKYECPVLLSKQISAVIVHELINYQSELLSPTQVVHAVLVEVYGIGVLITGNAGIGKSETALELITRGHRLVADDSVVVKNIGESLIGKSPNNIQFYLEVRGLGIINVQKTYGPGSVRLSKTVDMVVELVDWDEKREYNRLGTKQYEEILGIQLPKITMPVKPGRNIPVIIETAARKYRLDESGYDATAELLAKVFPNEKNS